MQYGHANFLGDESHNRQSEPEFLPILWLVGMRQQLVVDYNDTLSRGNQCLYLTSADPIFYLLVAPSLDIWLSQLV